ncbi:response regulator [Novosphingobium sp. BL-8H]|uniref:response regulator n=1 Tax=Novosphingobium sp. BL-8H TaxID=3127640 RepID=UPI0037574C41
MRRHASATVTQHGQLMRRPVLIVEDELFVILDLEDLIAEEGFVVAAHCGTVSATLKAIERQQPFCAILDVRLPDGEVYPAADRLRELGVPLIFHSGHANESALKQRYPDAQFCPKPSSPLQLRAALHATVDKAAKVRN